MHHRWPCLFILSCPFLLWSSLHSVILCEYKIRSSPLWGRNVLMSTSCRRSPLVIKNPLNWNSHLEFLWPSNTPYSWMVIFPFKDYKSQVDPECSYAIGRRVSGCPSTKFVVRIPLKTQALLATADIKLDFWLVHFDWTPRQFHHVPSLASRTLCVISELQYNIEGYTQRLLGGYLLLPADSCRIGAQCIRVFLFVHISNTQ
jgi:hypothetical protein